MSTTDSPGAVLATIDGEWRAVGLSGALLARNLNTGNELGIGADDMWSLASVIKLPIAVALHDLFASGEAAADEALTLDPTKATRGPTGASTFAYPSTISAHDLIGLTLAVSDNAATDALLDRYSIDVVNARLHALGCRDLVVRHSMRAIHGAAGAIDHLGPQVATDGYGDDGTHAIATLDPRRSNAGTARALTDLLERLWADQISTPQVCANICEQLSRGIVKHRMAHELASDDIRVYSKTGTFGGLRHEVGVVDLGSEQIAISILTRSTVASSDFPEADWAIGRAARLLVDHLRSD